MLLQLVREKNYISSHLPNRVKMALPHLPGSLLEAMWPAAESHLDSIQTHPADQNHAALLEFPQPLHLQIAASESVEQVDGRRPTPPVLRRLPLNISLAPKAKHGFAIPQTIATHAQKQFKRPEGSVAARVFGNTTHTFIELLAKEIATHAQGLLIPEIAIEEVFSKLSTWRPRIVNYLRSQGLSPGEVEQQPTIPSMLLPTSFTIRKADGF